MIKNIKKNGSASIEFLVVTIILFSLLMILIDLFLFFRQMYLVQAFNDEVFTRISMSGVCADSVSVSQIIGNVPIIIYFNSASQIVAEAQGNNSFKYSNDRYAVYITCKNQNVIRDAFTESYYNGIFMFKNKTVSSSLTTTLSYY